MVKPQAVQSSLAGLNEPKSAQISSANQQAAISEDEAYESDEAEEIPRKRENSKNNRKDD